MTQGGNPETVVTTVEGETAGTHYGSGVSTVSVMLAFCDEYATMLTLEVLPRFTESLLGSLGFGGLARLFQEFAARYVERVKQRCCSDAGVEELLERVVALNHVAGSGFRLLPTRVRRGPGRLDVVFEPGEACPGEGGSRRLCLAAYLGFVAGLFKAHGVSVLAASRRPVRPPAGVQAVVYPLAEASGGRVTVRVELLPGAPGVLG